jgi:hypothetical protein
VHSSASILLLNAICLLLDFITVNKVTAEPTIVLLCKSFGENICDVFVRVDIVNFKLASGNAFTERMISNVDMFDFSVERSVFGEDNSTVVIAHKRGRGWLAETEFVKEHAYPCDFFTCF